MECHRFPVLSVSDIFWKYYLAYHRSESCATVPQCYKNGKFRKRNTWTDRFNTNLALVSSFLRVELRDRKLRELKPSLYRRDSFPKFNDPPLSSFEGLSVCVAVWANDESANLLNFLDLNWWHSESDIAPISSTRPFCKNDFVFDGRFLGMPLPPPLDSWLASL